MNALPLAFSDPDRIRTRSNEPERSAGTGSATPLPDWYIEQRGASSSRDTNATGTAVTRDAGTLRYHGGGTRSAFDATPGASRDALPPPPFVGDEREVLERVRDERLAVLARKYASSVSSPELAARYQILTERLRQLSPRVSLEEVENLEETRRLAQQTTSELAAIKARFGLR